MDILAVLDGKWEEGTRPKDLYSEHISKNPSRYLNTILEGLQSEKKKVQSGCAELASFLSEDRPELLYPHVDLFATNLEAKAPVLRWEAVCTLGNLVQVDRKGITAEYIEKISEFLHDRSIVLQGHSIRSLGKMAKKFPNRAPEILSSLIGTAENLPGNRVGFLVEEMISFEDNPELREKAREFAESYIASDINVVSKKAKKAVRILSEKD